MTNDWQQSLTNLKAFIKEHPEVIIENNRTIIPEEVRFEFYRLFDETRQYFVLEAAPQLIKDAKPLALSFNEIITQIERLLPLKSFDIPGAIKWFTDDPINGLIRMLWAPVFDLLQAKTDIDVFKINESVEIRQVYSSLMHECYADWLELAMIKQLQAKHLLRVNAPTITGSFGHAQGSVMHLALNSVMPPEESDELSLVRNFSMVSFGVPDFIVYSAELGEYVSVKTELQKARWIASDASLDREWLPIENEKNIFGSGYLLIYVDSNPLNLALVNDVNRICRPDILLEFREQENWYSASEMQTIRTHHDIFKPRLGTFVASREELTGDLSQESESNIQFINVGTNDNQICVLVNTLKTVASK
jgi:hypothetical protein